MAVVQISRIQVRRGRKNSGTGFPQLASGEIGWAIDTQELYIGNGSVSEGSPAVGNTKILTERDITSQGNFLNLLRYTYQENNPEIVTGPSANLPVVRPIQQRLDDRVDIRDFIYSTDLESNDFSEAFQRAINQLYFNSTKASDEAGVDKRIILEFPPGVFPISQTLLIPSFATLVGAGADKTILQFVGTGSAIRFINDDNTSITYTLGNTQPRFITIKDLTIHSLSINQSGLVLDAVTNSTFENLILTGSWAGSLSNATSGIILNGFSDIVTSEHNLFRNITITGFAYAVTSNKDIQQNTFTDCKFYELLQGIRFGATSSGLIGEFYGPRNSTFQNCIFKDIKRHGIYIKTGLENYISNCTFENVGNNNGDHSTIQYPQIYCRNPKNSTHNIKSDRSIDLGNSKFSISVVRITLSHNVTVERGAYVEQEVTGVKAYIVMEETSSNEISLAGENLYLLNTSDNLIIEGDATPSTTNTAVIPTHIGNITSDASIPYIPEVAGHGEFKLYCEHTVALKTTSDDAIANAESAFRIPVSTSETGSPEGSIAYIIEYLYRESNTNFIRQGTLYISADVDNRTANLTDEYNFTGTVLNENYLKLDFKVCFLDPDGNRVVNPINQIPYSIDVKYTNVADSGGSLTYSYRSIF